MKIVLEIDAAGVARIVPAGEDLVEDLRSAEEKIARLEARAEQARRDLGSLVKIEDACPSCGARSLLIDPAGHLICSLPACKTSAVATAWQARVGAVEDLVEAGGNVVKFNGEEHRNKLAAALLSYAATKGGE